MRSRYFASAVLLLFICGYCLPAAGCAVKQFRAYQPRQFESYQCSASTDPDIRVAVEPMVSAKECQDYFGADLAKQGIVPVFVMIENRSRDSVYLVSPQEFTLALEKKSAFESLDAGTNTEGATALVTTGAVSLLICPVAAPALIIVGAQMSSDAQRIEQNYSEKQLKRQTIAPGRQASGFMYYQDPRAKDPSAAGMVLTVSLKNTNTNQVRQIPVSFRLEGKKS